MGKQPRVADTPLGTGVLGLFIAALAGVPAYLGAVHSHHGGRSWMLVVAVIVSLAMLGSAFLTTGRVRDRDMTYGRVFLACFAITVVLLAVLVVIALVQDTMQREALRNALFFLAAPVLGAIGLVVERTTGRRSTSH